METKTLPAPQNPAPLPQHDYQANVDTSRPFRSVKEAVAIFGDRLLLGEMYSPQSISSSSKPCTKQEYTSSWKHKTSTTEDITSPHDDDDEEEEEVEKEMSNAIVVVDTLKRLEAELEETKVELKLLKERESETEVALASLNAELHKNMSKLAQAEAAAAAKASLHVATRSSVSPTTFDSTTTEKDQERMKREWMIRMEDSTSLAQILSIGTDHDQKQGYANYGGGKRERKMMKKKPIVPLVQDLFSRKKGSSTLHNSLYSSPLYY